MRRSCSTLSPRAAPSFRRTAISLPCWHWRASGDPRSSCCVPPITWLRMSSRNCSWRICRSSSRTSKRDAWSPSARGTFESGRCRCAEPRAARWLNTGMGACNMAGMETQGRAALVWIVWFDRFVARWLFAFIALSAIGLALLAVTTHGWVHVVLSLPGHLLIAVAAGGIALLTRSATRRRGAVICLLGDLAAIVPNLLWVGGHQWRGLLTGVLLLPVLVPATRRALSAEPADAIAGGAQTTPEVVAARGQVASQVPGRQVHGFRKPALVLNPRSGSVQAVRDQLLEAAGRYGVRVREAGTPAELVALAREAVAGGADVLGVAGGDGWLAATRPPRSRRSWRAQSDAWTSPRSAGGCSSTTPPSASMPLWCTSGATATTGWARSTASSRACSS